jgi:ComF family protein
MARKRYWTNDHLLQDRVTTLFKYDGIMRDMIHKMKFAGRRDIASELGKCAADHMKQRIKQLNLLSIVPIPLHSIRTRERGYDQSLIIAQQISKETKIPLRRDLIQRIRNTRPQSHLSDAERLTNLSGAFIPIAHKQQLSTSVLLVDDVIHTGATARECVTVLQQLGVNEIHVLAIAG